jgi:hypothetical protein
MSVFTLIIFISAVLSILAAADPYVLHGGIRPDLERRQAVVLSETTGTTASSSQTGVKGSPLAVSSTPTASPTLVPTGQVAVPINPTTSASTSTQGGQVGVPVNQPGTSSSVVGVVGTPASHSSTTSHVGIVGTPGTHASSLNFFQQHSINSNLPNYAVVIIVILSGILCFAMGALALLRYQKYRQVKTENRRKLEDEEDVFDKYNKHWKSKRDSGSKVSSPVDSEKGI